MSWLSVDNWARVRANATSVVLCGPELTSDGVDDADDEGAPWVPDVVVGRLLPDVQAASSATETASAVPVAPRARMLAMIVFFRGLGLLLGYPVALGHLHRYSGGAAGEGALVTCRRP